MKSLIEQLKETIDRPLESFLDNADEAFTGQKEQEVVMEQILKDCPRGHICTSDCGKHKECPCNEHCHLCNESSCDCENIELAEDIIKPQELEADELIKYV